MFGADAGSRTLNLGNHNPLTIGIGDSQEDSQASGQLRTTADAHGTLNLEIE
jgi:hypothetical protein